MIFFFFQMKTRWNDIKKERKKSCMSSVTLRNRWGSFRWSPGHRGRRRKPPAALPGTPVQLWLLCVVECFLSPVGQENNNNNTMLRRTSSCVHAKREKAFSLSLTGWKKLACAPRDKSLRQVSKFPVRTLEWSC